MRGFHPDNRAHLARVRAEANAARTAKAAAGREYALAWRARNKPIFDAMYGVEA